VKDKLREILDKIGPVNDDIKSALEAVQPRATSPKRTRRRSAKTEQ
jgi:hypothetical protein